MSSEETKDINFFVKKKRTSCGSKKMSGGKEDRKQTQKRRLSRASTVINEIPD
jgi:hypothetical protein